MITLAGATEQKGGAVLRNAVVRTWCDGRAELCFPSGVGGPLASPWRAGLTMARTRPAPFNPVSFFMNKFRKVGFINYSGHGGGDCGMQTMHCPLSTHSRRRCRFRRQR